MTETGLSAYAALHDARRDEVYLQMSGMDDPAVLPFEDALAAILRIDGRFALAGTARADGRDAPVERRAVRRPPA